MKVHSPEIARQKTRRKKRSAVLAPRKALDQIKKENFDFNYRVEEATHEAYLDALASGAKVIIKKNNQLVQVSPDGSEKILKSIPRLKSRFKDSIILIG